MRKFLEYHEVTRKDVAAILVVLTLGFAVCTIFRKDYGDVILWCLAGIIPIVFSWMSAKTHKLKISAELLAAQYFANFLQPVCRHLKDRPGIALADGTDWPRCTVTVVIPDRISDDINAQLTELKDRLREISAGEIKTEMVECAGRPRSMMVDVATQRGILDFPTILSGINIAIAEIYPGIFSEYGEKYDKIRDTALRIFIAKIKSTLRRYPAYESLVSITHEKDLVTEYAKSL